MHAPSYAYTYRPTAVRLGEFDLGGVLYHARYLHLFEEAREALLREHGAPYPSLAAAGQHLAVTELEQQFLHPIRYGDELLIKLWIDPLKRSSLTFNYRILSENDRVLHAAKTRHVFVISSQGRLSPSRLPQKLLEVFEKFTAPIGQGPAGASGERN